MSRLFTRIFCAAFFVCGSHSLADIPMVTGPIIRAPDMVIPRLPQHKAQEFNGVTEVAVRSGGGAHDILDVQPQVDLSAFGVACGVDLHVETRPDAMIALSVMAPCKPHAAVHVSHGGLNYETQVSLTGQADIEFPAMQRTADVSVEVGAYVFVRQVEVEEAAHFARIALVGDSDKGAELVATSLSEEMEVFSSRGVQVFSVDLRTVDAQVTYRMKLRHHVTAENCDKPVQTHLRRILPGMVQQDQILKLTPQECSRVGDILELNNVVQDLKLAAY